MRTPTSPRTLSRSRGRTTPRPSHASTSLTTALSARQRGTQHPSSSHHGTNRPPRAPRTTARADHPELTASRRGTQHPKLLPPRHEPDHPALTASRGGDSTTPALTAPGPGPNHSALTARPNRPAHPKGTARARPATRSSGSTRLPGFGPLGRAGPPAAWPVAVHLPWTTTGQAHRCPRQHSTPGRVADRGAVR
jgi:hypothetical protein